ncbi:MAG: VacJ family lipoprotein [Proteobacteria bacterium]|nr:VacJ family lipoprotein [Pseudomonadota bacterium]
MAADRSAAAVGADGSIHVAAIQLAAVTPAGDDDGADPLEGLNRAIFGFNEVVYDSLFRPIAKTYNAYVPKTVRSGVGNILNNINAPVVLANDIMQFEFHRALTTIARFLVNSTAGIFGIADAATEIGLVDHKEDFGQTLGFYGIGEGLYLVLPIFGPSNPRDAVGKFLVDPLLDPFGQYLSNTGRDAESYARTGMDGLKEYAGLIDELDQIKKTSVDYYAAIRSLYRQKRKGEIANGRQEYLPPIPNYNLNFLPTEDGSVARSN